MANRTIVKGNIGNALHSVAPDHIVTTANEIFDETAQKYQSQINQETMLSTEGIYDVSEKNPTGGPNSDGKFTLEYILSNANTLIPSTVRKGGMSIKFVQSSDNKYVQYLYVGTSTAVADFTKTVNWEKVNLETELNQLGGFNLTRTCSLTIAGNRDIFVIDFAVGDKFKIKIDANSVVGTSDELNILLWTSHNPVVFRQVVLTGKLGQWIEITAPIETHFIGIQTSKAYSPAAVFNGTLHIYGDLEKGLNEEKERAEAAFNYLDLEDVTSLSNQATKMSVALRKNDGTTEQPNYRTLDTINLSSATRQKAGLMSAVDKEITDYYLGSRASGSGSISTAGNVVVINSLSIPAGTTCRLVATGENWAKGDVTILTNNEEKSQYCPYYNKTLEPGVPAIFTALDDIAQVRMQTFSDITPAAKFFVTIGWGDEIGRMIDNSFNGVTLEDGTTAEKKAYEMALNIRKDGRLLNSLNIKRATADKAGLMDVESVLKVGYNNKSNTVYFTSARNIDVFDNLNICVRDKFKIKVDSENYTSGEVRLLLWTSGNPIIFDDSIRLNDKLGQWIIVDTPIETHTIGIQTSESYDTPVDFTAEIEIPGSIENEINAFEKQYNTFKNTFDQSFDTQTVEITSDSVTKEYPKGSVDWYSFGAGAGNYFTPTREDGVLKIAGLLKGGTKDSDRMYAGFTCLANTYTDNMVIITRGFVKGRNIKRVDLWHGVNPKRGIMLTQDVEDDQSIEVKGISDVSATNDYIAWHFISKDTSVDLVVDSTITEFFVCNKIEGYTVDDYLDLYEKGGIIIPKYHCDDVATKEYVDDNIDDVNHRIDDIASGTGVMPTDFDTDVVMLINYGQSLSVGDIKDKNAADFHKMLTFKGGSNEWASEVDITNAAKVAAFYGDELYEIEQYQSVNLGTTVSANALAWMQNLINKGIDLDNFDYQFLGSVPGYSGASIDVFKKTASKEHPYSGFNCYERLMLGVQKGKELANKAGKTFSVGAVFWVQGEADSRADNHDYYLATLRQLITDLNTDIKAITGQTRDIAFIIYQMSSYLEPNEQWQHKQGPSSETWIALELSLAGQEARKNNSNDISRLVYYGSSMYQYNYGTDLYHPIDRVVVGLQAGINAEKIINEDNPYPVFFIKDCQVQEDTVNNQWLLSLKFDVPVKPMRFYYPNDGYHNINGKQPNYGFRLVNSGDINIIASEPEIKRGDTLVIRCTQNPVGCKLSYAVDGHFGGGNLCDSQNQTFVISNITYHIDNFCPSFKDYIISL